MSKKVFELAKDLEMGPLDLVELLKSKGFPVRNHMAELSDSDVEKFLGEIRKAKEDEKSSSDSKKKVVRKKAASSDEGASATKKLSEKKLQESKKDENASAATSGLKKASLTKKKSTVIRRKTDGSDAEFSSDEESDFLDQSQDQHDEHHSSSQDFYNDSFVTFDSDENMEISEDLTSTHSAEDGQNGASKTQQSTSGLRVVSKPVVNKAKVDSSEVENKTVKVEEKKPETKRVEAKDRVHRFTPVYIPSQDPNHKKNLQLEEEKRQVQKAMQKPVQRTAPLGSAATASMDDLDDEARGRKLAEEEGNKKRMGGLASLMTGKKAVASKSQAINVTRADDELKSYMTLGGVGRPIYTQIMRKKEYYGPTSQTEITEVKESKRVVYIHKGVELGELARKLSVKFKDLIDQCLKINLLVKETDYVGPELTREICALYQYRVEDKAFNESKILGKNDVSDSSVEFPVRPPVVAIMGHVDHGKTTLLDSIRKGKVAQSEAGGITQHIGAYSVQTESGKQITFLDTPGHAAFAAMRQRGANATDVVVLVVAADDGVMPQTKESIRYCENAGVPIIVAINKMDKPGVNPDRVKQELTEFNLMPEEWGGQTQFVGVSALKGEGLDDLLEAIALQAEMLELRANPNGNVEGIVIESKIEQGRGPMATILVQSGTLKKGDSIVVGETFGRARSLQDHLGAQLNSAGPSTPVQILGLENAPTPGDIINVVKNEREAKKIAENRINERKLLQQAPEKKKTSLEDFFANATGSAEEKKLLNLIIRSDVQGSYEAIKSALESIGNDEVSVKVLGGGVGPITDSDVQLAHTSQGFIIGFNMRPVTSARKIAEDKGVDIKSYSIIYELINDVKLALEGLLDPEFVEEFIGRAEVREVFNIPKAGVIAGSYVIDGKIERGCNIRLLRNGKIMHDGKLSSLKRFKDDAKEVKNGYECGIALENYEDIKSGDIFEAYMMIQKKRTLEDKAGFGLDQSKENRPVL